MRSKPLAASLALLVVAAVVLFWHPWRRGGRGIPAAPRAQDRITSGEVGELLAAREERANRSEPSRSAVAPRPGGAAPVVAAPDAPALDALTVGARLLDEFAQPLAGGELAWMETSTGGLLEKRRSATSDRTGAVWLAFPRAELPAEGALLLTAGAPGRMRRLVSLARARWEHEALVSLAELTLPAGGDVFGRVLDERGAPSEGALVGLGPELGELTDEQRRQARLRPFLEDLGLGNAPPLALTDSAGRYTLEGVPTGRFGLVALRRNRGGEASLPDREEGVLVLPGQATRVRDMVLRSPAPEEILAGLVLAPDGAAVEGALVSLADPAGSGQFQGAGESGADGRFALLALAGRSYRLTARDALRRWRAVELSAVHPGGAEVVLRFTEPMPAPPTLFDPDSSPLTAPDPAASAPTAPESHASASLSGRLTLGGRPAASWNARILMRHTRLDHEGAFLLTELPAGHATLGLSTEPGRAVARWLTAELELGEGANEWFLDVPTAELVLANLPRAEPAEKDGLDWPEYCLTGEGVGCTWSLFFQESEEARAELHGVPAGHHRLRYRGPGTSLDASHLWPVALEFDLHEGPRQTIVLP